MYRLLIADDEQIVLDSIRFIVEKNFTDVVVAGTARSGREAIEKAENLKPDIIFMDIMMPGINGIEAIKEIRARLGNVMFVILTAYDQFDFAKEAVTLEVMEYLLKPVSQGKIVMTLKKSVEAINREREKRKRELELKERLESVLPIAENGFIYSMLLFDDFGRDFGIYKDIFELDKESGYVVTVKFIDPKSDGTVGNRTILRDRCQAIYPYLRESFKRKCKCLVGPLMLDRFFVYIPAEPKGDDQAMKLEAAGIAEYVCSSMTDKGGLDVAIGIGRVCRTLEDISRSYEESIRAARYLSGSGYMHIMDVPSDAAAISEYPIAKERLLLEKAASGETDACLQVFDQIYDWLLNEYPSCLHKIKKRLLELMVLIHRMGQNYKNRNEECFSTDDYVEELLGIEDPVELRVWCRERIGQISQAIGNMMEKRMNSLILKAVNYIRENYRNEIALEDISRRVNISPHYFSKLFKEQVGENFIDYITSLRIQKAKELLSENRLSIKEICFDIGYADPNYFSRLFKRVVGITPTEYREAASSAEKTEYAWNWKTGSSGE
jgi:two-component system response regulator YesN